MRLILPILICLIIVLKAQASRNSSHKSRKSRTAIFNQPTGQCLTDDFSQPHSTQIQSSNGRSFNANITGIFSCMHSDEITSAKNHLTLDFRLAKSAIELALNTIKQDTSTSRINFDVAYRTGPDMCRHQRAGGHAAEAVLRHNSSFFVGPSCSESLASVGQLASFWDIPMCSTGFLPEIEAKRFKPMTMMQLSLSVGSVGEMLLELFNLYKWRHLIIVTDHQHPLHSLIRDGLLEFFKTQSRVTLRHLEPTKFHVPSKEGGRVTATGEESLSRVSREAASEGPTIKRDFKEDQIDIMISNLIPYTGKYSDSDYEKIMENAASFSRIMLLLVDSKILYYLLSAAKRLDMSERNFVFLTHELFGNSSLSTSTSIYRNRTRRKCDFHELVFGDRVLVQDHAESDIYRPLMTISLKIPLSDKFGTFLEQVLEKSENEFEYCLKTDDPRNVYSLGVAALIHDCVMLYANRVKYLLEQTDEQNVSGSTIFKVTAGKTIPGFLTGDLTINRAGQRIIDFKLNSFSSQTLDFEPFALFNASERRLELDGFKPPYWEALRIPAPTSDPRCRLDDLFPCRGRGEQTGRDPFSGGGHLFLSFVAIILAIILTSSLVGWLIYRRFRIESELLNLWWSIKYQDILFEDEQEQMSDVKRSLSSLAISNESFVQMNSPQQQQQPQNVTTNNSQQTSPNLQQSSSNNQNQSGRSSPLSGAGIAKTEDPNQLTVMGEGDSGGKYQHSQIPIQPQAGGFSGAHSISSLSVATHSIGGASCSGKMPDLASSAPSSARQAALGLSGVSLNKLTGGVIKQATWRHHQKHDKSSVAGLGRTARSGNQDSGRKTERSHHINKDPSISSQNKNVKLRLGTVLNGGRDDQYTTKVGLYKASRVAVKHLNVKNINVNRQLLIELRQVRDLTHENLIKFIGLCPEEPNVVIVSELCTRGNLQDLLQNETIRLDWAFRYSIINDIVDGLQHLHSSAIQHHGRLKSSNCVIDNRFVVKLTDFGLPTLLASIEIDDQLVNPRHLLWTAPEHLRTKHPLLSGSAKGDIYSLAIILQEIITRCGPFECEPILCTASSPNPDIEVLEHQVILPDVRLPQNQYQPLSRRNNPRGPQFGRNAPPMVQPVMVQHKQRLEPDEIVNLVRMGLSPPFRPYFRPDILASSQHMGNGGQSEFNVADLIALVQSCWQEMPASRPTIGSVKQQIKKTRRGHHLEGSNLMDNLLQRMERYTDNLESLVEQKTAELMEEKKRSEELLYEMLPRFVVDQLKYGHSVTPEAYEAVTISFSDIKDFTSIAAQSSPIEVVNLLNQLYTEFDDCIAQYDVYKVETIGDAYMVVSGLPVRNGDQHASEIAEMSLALLELIRNFEVAHLPHVNLELRIGIHSGPCASGVVGTRMFRYCLFGDTVSLYGMI